MAEILSEYVYSSDTYGLVDWRRCIISDKHCGKYSVVIGVC